MELLLQIGFSITGFTTFVLLIKNDGKHQSKFAILILLLWFIRFLSLYLKLTVDLLEFPFLIVFDQNLLFLDGVFFYWYIYNLNNTQKFKKYIIQLIPFFIALGLSVLTFFAVGSLELVELYKSSTKTTNIEDVTPEIDTVIFILSCILFNVFFIYKSIGLLNNYKKALTGNLSNLKNIEVTWLIKLTYFWLVCSFIPFVLFSVSFIFHLNVIETFEYLYLFGLWLISILFSVNIITHKYPREDNLLKPSKTATSKDSQKESIQIFARLKEYMESKEPFKDETLTLNSLAEQMAIHPSKLSIAINTQNKTNFHEYINRYRIESVKSELTATTEQIIIIAYKNGFNSKSTFNTVFKKMTGMTPSLYRKSVQSDKISTNK